MASTAGERFARAVAAQNRARLHDVLADGIDFEALTPGRHWRASTRAEVIDEIILGVWFSRDADVHELRALSTGLVAGRKRVTYRLGVRRGGREHVVEQQAYYDCDGGRITWMRILCSGYRPDRERVAAAAGGTDGHRR